MFHDEANVRASALNESIARWNIEQPLETKASPIPAQTNYQIVTALSLIGSD